MKQLLASISALLFTTVASFSQVSTFPYVESFENGLGDWTQPTNDDFDWSENSGETASIATGPSMAPQGNQYVYVESSSPNFGNNKCYLLANFDFSSLQSPILVFDYHMYGADIGRLQVDVRDGNWDNNIWSLSGEQQNSESDNWGEAIIDLNAYAGSNNIRIRLRGITGDSYRGDIAVDYIRIYDDCSNNGGNVATALNVLCDSQTARPNSFQ